MLEAISANSSASAAMNVLLREFGNVPRGRGSSTTGRVEASESAGGVRGKSVLTEEERKEVEKLQRRDQEVRRHEAAHQAAAGAYARGGATFDYTTGPDGRQYASGGEVQIDTSEVSGDPQATINKMQQVRRAANAPADPSAEDRRIAAEAAAVEAEARAELTRERREENNDDNTASDLNVARRSSSREEAGAPRPLGDVTPHGGAGLGHETMKPGRARRADREFSVMPASPFNQRPKPDLEPGRFIDLTV